MDKRNEQVAVSSRPFVVPYQSRISKTLEGVILWPLRMVGLSRRSETVMVREELMHGYKEGSEPTERFEFSLSTNAADIEAVYLSIFPRLNLLTTFMFYHPNLSAVIGVSLIASVLLCFCAVILCVYYFFKFLTNPDSLSRRELDNEEISYHSDEDDDSISEDSDELFLPERGDDGMEDVGKEEYLSVSGFDRNRGELARGAEVFEDNGSIASHGSGEGGIVRDEGLRR